jgi:hypothetical protein
MAIGDRSHDVPALAVLLLLAGAAFRVATLAVPGTWDVIEWKTWIYTAATEGPAHVYGHESPPVRHVVRFGRFQGVPNYPPLAIYELGLIGRVHALANRGELRNGPALTMTIRGAIVLMDAAVAALLFGVVGRWAGRRHAMWSAAAYWISPAVLLTTTLGYIDVFFALPAVGALVAASSKRPALAGGLFAAALMTKPQAFFVGPALALALWNVGERADARRRLLTSIAAAVIVSVALTLPIVLAGTTLNMLGAMASMLRHDMLSGTACNLWWIVGYVIQAAEASHSDGVTAPWRTLAEIVPISSVTWSPRSIGTLLTLAAAAWALRVAKGARDLALLAALGAFVVDAYFTLSAQVHENHFFMIMPLLALAAALRRPFAPILVTLGTVFALNLYLFYGIQGRGVPAIVRTSTIVDSTVLLSIVNCGVFAWFAVTFHRACRTSNPGSAPRTSAAA